MFDRYAFGVQLYGTSGGVTGCQEDGLPVDGYVVIGSPPFISHESPFGRGPTTLFRGLTITMVINHLLNGMILQVGPPKNSFSTSVPYQLDSAVLFHNLMGL